MNNSSNGGGGYVGDSSGAEYWTYQGATSTWQTHNSPMRRNQPSRMPPTPSMPHYVPPPTRPTANTAPTYAQVARIEPPVPSNTRSYTAVYRNPEGESLHRQPMRPTQHVNQQQTIGGPFDTSSTYQAQYQQPQGFPSYADVVAGGTRNNSSPPQSHVRTANPVSFGYNPNLQQYGQPRVDHPQYNTANGYGYRQHTSLEELTAIMVDNNAGTLDQFADWNLLDSPMAGFLLEPPSIAARTVRIDTSSNANVDPSQLLKSPADSVDTSSVTSSTRRSKREIMGGASGDHKCLTCGGGFLTLENLRHHVARVHIPYSERPHPCPKCEERFVFRKDLTRHDRQKHGNRMANARFRCTFDGCKYAVEGFVRRDNYIRHLATHNKADSANQMSRSTSTHTFSQP